MGIRRTHSRLNPPGPTESFSQEELASSEEAVLALSFADDNFASENKKEATAVPVSQEDVPVSQKDAKDDTQRDIFK